ncbi:hypothetical protein CALCODRAFT_515792 [Calocera cornea HHB12733]|uniref:CCHC-type domain-containing protein n=1 Tax=Calocera cornea HHB12733 TaxID=1353952 RepID=A0A165HXN6_9BASI|nr:hypothetical protein CALCODRAFT_515792 [Calocera cornea HHB12733]
MARLSDPVFRSTSPDQGYEDTWDWSDKEKTMTQQYVYVPYGAPYPHYHPPAPSYSAAPPPSYYAPPNQSNHDPYGTQHRTRYGQQEPAREHYRYGQRPPWRSDGDNHHAYDARERSPIRNSSVSRYPKGPHDDRRSAYQRHQSRAQADRRKYFNELKTRLYELPPVAGEPPVDRMCFNCGSETHQSRDCHGPDNYHFREACKSFNNTQMERRIAWRRWIHFKKPLPSDYDVVPVMPILGNAPVLKDDAIKQDEDMADSCTNPLNMADHEMTPPANDPQSSQKSPSTSATSIKVEATATLAPTASPRSVASAHTSLPNPSSHHLTPPASRPSASPHESSPAPPSLHVSPQRSSPPVAAPQDTSAHTSSLVDCPSMSPHPSHSQPHNPPLASSPPESIEGITTTLTSAPLHSPPVIWLDETEDNAQVDTSMLLDSSDTPDPAAMTRSDLLITKGEASKSISSEPVVSEPTACDLTASNQQLPDTMEVDLIVSEPVDLGLTISDIMAMEQPVPELLTRELKLSEGVLSETMGSDSMVSEATGPESMVEKLMVSAVEDVTPVGATSDLMISESVTCEPAVSEPVVADTRFDDVLSDYMMIEPTQVDCKPAVLEHQMKPTMSVFTEENASHSSPSQKMSAVAPSLSISPPPVSLPPKMIQPTLEISPATELTQAQPSDPPKNSIPAIKSEGKYSNQKPAKPQSDWTLRHSSMPTLRGFRMQDNLALLHFATDRVDVMNRLAKPAKDDPRFEERWTTDNMNDVQRKLRDNFVIKLHGGENWTEKGFNINTLLSEGVVRSRDWAENKKYEFQDLNLIARRETDEKAGHIDIYANHTFKQFFEEATDVQKRNNLLDCYYESYNWPPYLRSLQSRTLRSYNGEIPSKSTAMEVSELTEETWFIASHGWSWTGGHHDAGGRYTYIQVMLGEKWWYYFRPNEETLKRMEEDAEGVALDLVSYDYEKMNGMGTFYYVPVMAGDALLQPSWTKHFVWTPEDSFMAGKLFDLPSFERTERCMREEYVCGETSTNANRHGWYSALLNFAVTLPSVKPDRQMLPDHDLRALHRMLLNPRVYVPQDGEFTKKQDINLFLVVDEVQRLRAAADAKLASPKKPKPKPKPKGKAKPGESAPLDARQVTKVKYRRYHQDDDAELDAMHGVRVQLLGEAIPALEAVFKERGLEVPEVKMLLYPKKP